MKDEIGSRVCFFCASVTITPTSSKLCKKKRKLGKENNKRNTENKKESKIKKK
jgi:hypothetical protein